MSDRRVDARPIDLRFKLLDLFRGEILELPSPRVSREDLKRVAPQLLRPVNSPVYRACDGYVYANYNHCVSMWFVLLFYAAGQNRL